MGIIEDKMKNNERENLKLAAEVERVMEDHFDVMQETSNAGFGDMLHDKERNVKYYEAIRKTIKKMHSEGKEVHVLDIGTGTGLLSMMSVVSGADSVVACEAFLPMANCAEEIIKANGMSDKIKLIKKRSTELKVGPNCDMERKANLLVAELLDTELIGEGAIVVYNHAHEELLTEDVICIPSLATCYAQVVDSPLAAQCNTFKSLTNLDAEVLLSPSKEMLGCQENHRVRYMQLSQFPRKSFHMLSKALEIFKFDFMRQKPMETSRTKHFNVEALQAGSANLVFFWWDIFLDAEEEILLSCAPYWEHPDLGNLAKENKQDESLWSLIPWRDHWMQAVYYIPKPLNIPSKGNVFTLLSYHDEFSFGFDVLPGSDNTTSSIKTNFCTCSLHEAFSRSRIGQINQSRRNKIFMRYLEEEIQENSKVLVLSDGSVLGLSIRKLGAKQVTLLEPDQRSRKFMEALTEYNQVDGIRFIENIDQLDEKELGQLTHIFGEPHFIKSILPWDDFYFGSLLAKILPKLSPTVKISPIKAKIMCVPVEFVDLQKMSQPLVECEGFNLRLFDEMVLKAKEATQANVEVYPLWEYPCRALSQPKVIFQSKFKDYLKHSSTFGTIPMEVNGTCNGVALWAVFYIDENLSVNTGITEDIEPGQFIHWNMFHQQGVHLMEAGTSVQKEHHSLEYEVEFHPDSAKLGFHFNIAFQDE